MCPLEEVLCPRCAHVFDVADGAASSQCPDCGIHLDLITEQEAAKLGLDHLLPPDPSGRGGPALVPPSQQPRWEPVEAPSPRHDHAPLDPDPLADGPPAETGDDDHDDGLVEVPCPICAGAILVAVHEAEGTCPHCLVELEFEVEDADDPQDLDTDSDDGHTDAHTAVEPAGHAVDADPGQDAPAAVPPFDPMLAIRRDNAPLVRAATPTFGDTVDREAAPSIGPADATEDASTGIVGAHAHQVMERMEADEPSSEDEAADMPLHGAHDPLEPPAARAAPAPQVFEPSIPVTRANAPLVKVQARPMGHADDDSAASGSRTSMVTTIDDVPVDPDAEPLAADASLHHPPPDTGPASPEMDDMDSTPRTNDAAAGPPGEATATPTVFDPELVITTENAPLIRAGRASIDDRRRPAAVPLRSGIGDAHGSGVVQETARHALVAAMPADAEGVATMFGDEEPPRQTVAWLPDRIIVNGVAIALRHVQTDGASEAPAHEPARTLVDVGETDETAAQEGFSDLASDEPEYASPAELAPPIHIPPATVPAPIDEEPVETFHDIEELDEDTAVIVARADAIDVALDADAQRSSEEVDIEVYEDLEELEELPDLGAAAPLDGPITADASPLSAGSPHEMFEQVLDDDAAQAIRTIHEDARLDTIDVDGLEPRPRLHDVEGTQPPAGQEHVAPPATTFVGPDTGLVEIGGVADLHGPPAPTPPAAPPHAAVPADHVTNDVTSGEIFEVIEAVDVVEAVEVEDPVPTTNAESSTLERAEEALTRTVPAQVDDASAPAPAPVPFDPRLAIMGDNAPLVQIVSTAPAAQTQRDPPSDDGPTEDASLVSGAAATRSAADADADDVERGDTDDTARPRSADEGGAGAASVEGADELPVALQSKPVKRPDAARTEECPACGSTFLLHPKAEEGQCPHCGDYFAVEPEPEPADGQGPDADAAERGEQRSLLTRLIPFRRGQPKDDETETDLTTEGGGADSLESDEAALESDADSLELDEASLELDEAALESDEVSLDLDDVPLDLDEEPHEASGPVAPDDEPAVPKREVEPLDLELELEDDHADVTVSRPHLEIDESVLDELDKDAPPEPKRVRHEVEAETVDDDEDLDALPSFQVAASVEADDETED